MFVAPFMMPSIWLFQKPKCDKRENILLRRKHEMSNGAIVTSNYRIQTRLIKYWSRVISLQVVKGRHKKNLSDLSWPRYKIQFCRLSSCILIQYRVL